MKVDKQGGNGKRQFSKLLYVVNRKWADAGEKRREAFSHFGLAEKYDHCGGPLFRRWTRLVAWFFSDLPRPDLGGPSRHRLAVRYPVIHGTVDGCKNLTTRLSEPSVHRGCNSVPITRRFSSSDDTARFYLGSSDESESYEHD